MSLDSLSGVLGEFWLPTDKSNKVPGILTIEPESDTRELSLNGLLADLFLSSSENNEPTVIHGYIGGTMVTFIGCFCTSQVISSVSTQKYHVPLIVSGAHITDKSKRVIRRAYLRFDNIHSWMPPKPIDHSRQYLGRKGWKIDISATSTPLIERSRTYFGSIEVYKSSFFHVEYHKAEVMSQSTIIFTYPKGASIEELIEHCGSIRNLAAMMTSTSCNVTLLELVVSLPSAYKDYEIKLYLDWVGDRVIKEPSEFEVITYTELGGIDAIAKCLNTSQDKNNHAVLRRLGSFWISEAPFNESKFIHMTVALEYLYKATCCPNSKKGGGKVDLEDKLNAVIHPIADDIALIIPNMKWLGTKVARYRGWAAHAVVDDPPEGLLYVLMRSLHLCIMLRYVYDLGADLKEICQKVHSRHLWFRRWASVLQETMEKHP